MLKYVKHVRVMLGVSEPLVSSASQVMVSQQTVCYSESERREEAKKRLEKRLEKRENT